MRLDDDGKLQMQRCAACGHVPNFPRVACPSCLGAIEWVDASGRGVVQAFTVVHRTHDRRYEPHVPIVMALVRLEEGAESISTLVGKDRLEVAIGAPVRATRGWSVLPQFELAR